MCARGKYAMTMSVGRGKIVPCAIADAITDTKLMCVSTTPLGMPVEPEVYMLYVCVFVSAQGWVSQSQIHCVKPEA